LSRLTPAATLVLESGLAAEAHVIVQIQQVEPGHNVRALGRGGLVQAVEILARIRIVRRALFLPRRPGEDFRRGAFMFGVLVDPFEDFGVAFL
jgi:hypothetical protein